RGSPTSTRARRGRARRLALGGPRARWRPRHWRHRTVRTIYYRRDDHGPPSAPRRRRAGSPGVRGSARRGPLPVLTRRPAAGERRRGRRQPRSTGCETGMPTESAMSTHTRTRTALGVLAGLAFTPPAGAQTPDAPEAVPAELALALLAPPAPGGSDPEILVGAVPADLGVPLAADGQVLGSVV